MNKLLMATISEEAIMEFKEAIERRTGTASIKPKVYCKECGWPIVDACCNGKFAEFRDAADWDWWFYCSNKGCFNHDGEGVFQNWPDWVGTEDD